MNSYSIVRPEVLSGSEAVLDVAEYPAVTHGPRRPIPSGYRLFLRECLRSFRSTASVIPSSRFLSAALLEPIDFDTARVVVELGPGTGAITAEILRRLRPDARLIAVERNHRFVSHLRRCEDPRLILVHGSAESLRSELSSHGIRSREVHAIVSSLGLTAMPPTQRDRILRQARACLSPAGTMTQYQYITSFAGQGDSARLSLQKFRAGEFLQNYFQDVTVRRIYLNFPPARVFACR